MPPLGDYVSEEITNPVCLLWRHEIERCLADDLVGYVSHNWGHIWAAVCVHAVEVHLPQDVASKFDKISEPDLAIPPVDLCSTCFGHKGALPHFSDYESFVFENIQRALEGGKRDIEISGQVKLLR